MRSSLTQRFLSQKVVKNQLLGKAMLYKTAVGATLFLYAIIAAIILKFYIEDLYVEIDWDYCHAYTSCADSECCIEATAEKGDHLKYD